MNLQVFLRGAHQFGAEARRLIESAAAVELASDEQARVLAETIRRVYQGLVRGEAPVAPRGSRGHRPGFLRDTIRGEIRTSGRGLVVAFASDATYTGYVIGGTAPHVIRARNARYLVFEGRDGSLVRVRSVNHPGTRPNPFNVRAYERSRPAIEAALALVGRAIAVSFRG